MTGLFNNRGTHIKRLQKFLTEIPGVSTNEILNFQISDLTFASSTVFDIYILSNDKKIESYYI